MRFFALGSLLLAGASTSLAANTTCSPTSSDSGVLQFAWGIQSFINQFYSSVPINQTLVSALPNSSSVNYVTNLRNLERQNRWSTRALKQLGDKVGFQVPTCSYTFPEVTNGTSFLEAALQLESTISGAFIGLAGFTQAPEVSFLLARVAAQHAAQATYIASNTQSIVFKSNSTFAIEAYTPEEILSSGKGPGKLGDYLGGCLTAPSGPCGLDLVIGPLTANLVQPSGAAAASSSAEIASSVFATSTPSISSFAASSSAGASSPSESSTPASASASPSST